MRFAAGFDQAGADEQVYLSFRTPIIDRLLTAARGGWEEVSRHSFKLGPAVG